MNRSSLIRFTLLSVAAAVVTIVLKAIAYLLTGSVGLLSDALESLVNLAGALVATAMLTVALRPADARHNFGHDKAEYFSSGFEGSLILVAAFSIAVAAIRRLMAPQPIEQVGLGLAVSVAASLINLGVSRLLLRVSKQYDSITLEANARHLMTDVRTSVGVIAGVGAVALTGWLPLDSLVALAVAANIVRTGVGIVRRSLFGLMDTALPAEDQAAVQKVLEEHRQAGVTFADLRTRQAGARHFVELTVRVPSTWTVTQGHDLLVRIEQGIAGAISNVAATTHLEPALAVAAVK